MKQLAEIQHIESIIESYHKSDLSSKVLCQVPSDGESFPIYWLSLGNQALDLPSVTFVGGVHGLERIGSQVVLAFLETLLQRLNWDLSLVDILQGLRINFVPIINPVGMLNHTRANGQGVDLMRNASVECHEKSIWLVGGHRISPLIPWYRGKADEPMQLEAQILCDFISSEVLPAPFSLVLDCHSGFGFHDRIWFPYAKSRRQPIKHLGEICCLRKLFMQTYPYQNYHFEPQSQHYLTHGDLWDLLYQESLKDNNIFLPLTLEMGSWRWIRKNPLQLRKSLGLFHPMKQHRINRVLRRHLVLMEFLLHAAYSYSNWLSGRNIDEFRKQALESWYHE